MMPFIFDMNYILWVLIPGMLLSGWATWRVKRAYHRAAEIPAASGVTGAQAAAKIMLDAGMDHVAIEQTQGWLSDHYDPSQKVLRLSPDVYHGRSLAALGIAAHEAGHALQDARNYAPLVIRNAIVPMASIGSNLSYIVLIAGVLLQAASLVLVGVALFAGVVVFQLINLPCEFNASSRARQELQTLGLVTGQEDGEVKRVLNAAAMTYVAGVITSVMTLLYYIMLFAGGEE